ncbi:MAG: HAMP domain-containing sensor histidine kinase [Eubacteriales bacterium]|nr:HAMP domain-containing sensor histidine kinase [Eubacteriales bacterium]
MNGFSIRRLRRRFMQITMLSLMLAMFIMNALLYLGTTALNRKIIYNTLSYIIDHDGMLENWDENAAEKVPAYIHVFEELFSATGDYRSPEFRYSTRYFAVYFDTNENVTNVKTSYISAVTDEEAAELGEKALARKSDSGRFDSYYYMIDYEQDGSGMVVYLDGRNTLHNNNRILSMALIVTGFGIIIAFIIARIITNRVIQSEIKNVDIQKRFMTDISHELKTPLAVIRANTEMQEVLDGESEWSASTLRQVDRMNGLIQSLVMISRAEEKQNEAAADIVDVTAAVSETVNNFRAMVINSGKSMTENIDENVKMLAEESQIRQLCSLLVDNAIKYCDDAGVIDVSLKHKGHSITLEISNSYAAGAEVDYTRFFDRFYRQDDSHNIDKGGYGIGLSIAESIVQRHKGTIDVSWKQGVITFKSQFKTGLL